MERQNPFERLIRFQDDEGVERYGNLPMSSATDSIIGSSVEVIKGDFKNGFTKSETKSVVRKLLPPVPKTNLVPCIGLNYRQHATEAKMSIPSQPVVFTKPPDALAGPYDDLHIHPEVQSQLDYEGELTIVIGQNAKNIKAKDALNYVLGFTAGNDVSARDFQVPASVSGGQFGYAKSFDDFAPIGPCITATAIIGDPQSLNYVTRVNGEVRQRTSTNDMIWSVGQIIEHLSRGTTLRAGTCIMTGTPSGVAVFMNPQVFLKDGDVVEVEIEKIGTIKNKIVFD